MNSNVSPLLDVVKVDTLGQQKAASSSSRDSGFSDSFREAKNEYDQAHQQKAPQDKPTAKEPEHQEREAQNAHKGPSENDVSAEDVAQKATKEEKNVTEHTGSSEHAAAKSDKQDPEVASSHGADVSLSSLTAESSVEEILSILRGMIEEGDLKELEALLSPEEIAELVALVEDGNELPLNSTVISALEAIKQSTNHSVAAKGSTENTLAAESQGKRQALHQENVPQAGELKSSTTAEKSTVATTSELSLKSAGNTSPTEGVLLKEGVVKQALEGGLASSLSNEEPGVTSSRLVNELLGPQATTAPALAKPQLSVATPFQQAQWGEAVAERVMWMSSKGIQEAEIHLDPPELGPLQVKVSVANEQAHVSFVVQHGSVREALDQSAMRLREMFEGENIDLVDVDVSDQSEQFADAEQEQATSGKWEDGEQTESETALHVSNNGYSLISTYV